MNRLESKYAEALRCESCRGAENWYIRKHRWIERRAKVHGVDQDLAHAVYALLSWNASVPENDRTFMAWITTGDVYHFGACERRIRQAEGGDIVGALTFKNAAKIATFNDNLRYPWSHSRGATIDRHAGDILTGDRKATKNMLARVRLTGYRWIERHYIRLARKVEWTPQAVQARVWVHHVECLGRAA